MDLLIKYGQLIQLKKLPHIGWGCHGVRNWNRTNGIFEIFVYNSIAIVRFCYCAIGETYYRIIYLFLLLYKIFT